MAIMPYSPRILRKTGLKKGTPRESDTSTCAALRGHVSNNWGFVVFVKINLNIRYRRWLSVDRTADSASTTWWPARTWFRPHIPSTRSTRYASTSTRKASGESDAWTAYSHQKSIRCRTHWGSLPNERLLTSSKGTLGQWPTSYPVRR